MIKFFRKIRQKLITENKFSKYLIYAIGEIVLVVIGILIALAINNWKEEKKKCYKEREVLVNIKQNLLNNIEFINEDLLSHRTRIQSSEIVLKVLNDKITFYDSLTYHIHEAPIFPNPELSYTAYESLKSIGFDIISDPNLKTEIMNLFEVTYSSMTRELNVIENQSVESGQLSFYLENFERSNGKAIPNNYAELILDQKFKNIIIFHKDIHELGMTLKNPCLDETKRIIDLIDKELDKNK